MRQIRVKFLVGTLLLLGVGNFLVWAGEGGQKYALLIGVNRYANLKDISRDSNLKYAERDVLETAKVLEKGGFKKDNIKAMCVENVQSIPLLPVAANIRKRLQDLVKDKKPEDTVLVMYSGYEMMFPGKSDYYVCPTDALAKDTKTMISLKEITEALASCKAGTKLVIVDSCRSVKDALKLPAPPAGVAVLFACSHGELAYELDESKHGLLTQYLLPGLGGAADANKDGKVTVGELAPWVRKQVSDHARTKLKVQQNPELLGQTGNGAFTSK